MLYFVVNNMFCDYIWICKIIWRGINKTSFKTKKKITLANFSQLCEHFLQWQYEHFFAVAQINYSVPWKLKYNFLCCLIGECLGLKLSWEILMFVIPRLSLKEDVLSIDSIESQLSMALTLPIRSPARPRTIPGQQCLHSTSPLSVPQREVVLNVTKALDWMRKMLNYNDL